MTDLALAEPPVFSSFASVAALRVAHRELLDDFDEQDSTGKEDEFSSAFLDQVDAFQAAARATGAIIAAPDERSEVQSTINFWSTILINAGRKPAPIVLDEFDQEAARARLGEAPPYKGLEPFQVGDAPSFFGRLSVIKAMVDRLRAERLLAVTGLSGSGKSSVVRAGLIPQLREGAIEGSDQWHIFDPIVPGHDPLLSLGRLVGSPLAAPGDLLAALDALERPAVVTIDQFEEVYTLSTESQPRSLFLDCLVAAVQSSRFRHVVVITMRGEYDGRVVAHEAFSSLFSAGRIVIEALSAADLRSAIELPAAQLGIALEAGLADELIARVLGEPAGLPLLQFTLLELWKRREGGALSWAAYQALGGTPRDILAHRADEVFEGLPLEEDRTRSQRIFTELVQLGDGLEATSRRIARDQIEGPRDNVDRVLGIWRQNGLIRISPSGPISPTSEVEVSHEALIRNWDRLVGWVEEAFASSRSRRVLTLRAQRWKEGKEEPLGELALAEAQDMPGLGPLEREYLAASKHNVEREKSALVRRRRRATVVLTGSGILLMISLILVVSLAQYRSELEREMAKNHRATVQISRQQSDLSLKQQQYAQLLENTAGLMAANLCNSHGKDPRRLNACVDDLKKQYNDWAIRQADIAEAARRDPSQARQKQLGTIGMALPPGNAPPAPQSGGR